MQISNSKKFLFNSCLTSVKHSIEILIKVIEPVAADELEFESRVIARNGIFQLAEFSGKKQVEFINRLLL